MDELEWDGDPAALRQALIMAGWVKIEEGQVTQVMERSIRWWQFTNSGDYAEMGVASPGEWITGGWDGMVVFAEPGTPLAPTEPQP